eukprot:m.44288 g.44288  ORF g.44288 m.44288 type:complete len:75 (+) comp12100_c0_seq2:105-329(+)
MHTSSRALLKVEKGETDRKQQRVLQTNGDFSACLVSAEWRHSQQHELYNKPHSKLHTPGKTTTKQEKVLATKEK